MVCRMILHGTGQQALGLLVVLLTYYIVGLPLGISLMFATSLRLTGLVIVTIFDCLISNLNGF